MPAAQSTKTRTEKKKKKRIEKCRAQKIWNSENAFTDLQQQDCKDLIRTSSQTKLPSDAISSPRELPREEDEAASTCLQPIIRWQHWGYISKPSRVPSSSHRFRNRWQRQALIRKCSHVDRFGQTFFIFGQFVSGLTPPSPSPPPPS
jgi:hypothetical protein